jgi:hypothetical protein
MTIDHLPSVIRTNLYEPLGFVSAAEGFVFLSGYVAGLTYTRVFSEMGSSTLMWHRAFRRAGEIYLYNIIIFASLFVVLKVAGDPFPKSWGWEPLLKEHWVAAIFLGATFMYQPRFLDILPMYCMLLLVTPVIIIHLRKGKQWVIWSISAGIWAVAQFGIRDQFVGIMSRWFPVNVGSFDFLAWQFLYVGALSLGFYYHTEPGFGQQRRPAILLVTFILAVGLFLFRHDLVPQVIEVSFGDIVSQRILGPVRLLNFLCLAILISHKAIWQSGRIWTKCLAYLGRNSLQVFSFHLVMVYLFTGLIICFAISSEFDLVCIALVAVMGLFCAARVNEIQRSKGPLLGVNICAP